MLGIAPLGALPLGGFPPFPPFGPPTSDTGLAWRRIYAMKRPGAELNRDAPLWLVYDDLHEEEEGDAIMVLLGSL